MKKDIHPKYYDKANIECACGNKFTTGSTVSNIKVEICSVCHPFFTGKQKFATAGRVDRFKAKLESTAIKQKATLKTERPSKPKSTKKKK